LNRQQWRLEPANEHTDMNQLNTAQPTHDEIALHAFLIWEKDGRQPGREQTYWLQAEAQLRQTRQQQIETAAKVIRQWPPAPSVAKSAVVTPAKAKAAKAASSRDVAVKSAPVAKATRRTTASASPRKAMARH